jgi:(4S)-4-hydroxy-5-phosphonooxypentane-2,3-dione isomerase
MPKLAIIPTVHVAPGRRDQLLHLLMAHKARCLKDEPEPRGDDAKVFLYEVYRDLCRFPDRSAP